MLFSIKNRLIPTLLLLVLFVTTSFGLRGILGLSWDLTFGERVVRDSGLGLAAIVTINGCLHLLFLILFGENYLSLCRALLVHFEGQRGAHFLAAGLLAAGEEMIFRGIILEGLLARMGLGVVSAVMISAFLFGLAHLIPHRRLAPFSLWAFWEGIFLGILYVKTHSLSVVMLAHFVNDTCGYALFALERKTGWLLREGANP